jgi:hypothetical protein
MGCRMPEKYYQRIAKEDNCGYFYDYEKDKWQKLSDVKDVPFSVKESFKEDIQAKE